MRRYRCSGALNTADSCSADCRAWALGLARRFYAAGILSQAGLRAVETHSH